MNQVVPLIELCLIRLDASWAYAKYFKLNVCHDLTKSTQALIHPQLDLGKNLAVGLIIQDELLEQLIIFMFRLCKISFTLNCNFSDTTIKQYQFIIQLDFHFYVILILLACAAIVSGGKGTAQDKIKTLREAGVTVVESPAKIGAAMLDVFKQRGLVQQFGFI